MMQQRPGSKRRGAVTITCVSVLLLVGVLTAGVLLLVFKPAQGPQQGAPYASKSTGAGKQAAGRKQEPVLDLFTVAKALDPEVMDHSLPPNTSFDPAFKNPCWKAADGQHRCLPYVYITGSFQAGVNTLYSKVSEHPDIITNGKSRWQLWGEDGKNMREYVEEHSSEATLKQLRAAPVSKVLLDGSASTFAFYWSAGLRAHRAFQRTMVPCWRECSEGAKGNDTKRIECMERTCHPRALAADQAVAQGLGVPYDALHMPLIMSAAYGGTYKPKLIVLIRDPIDRLHSAYWAYPHYKGKYGATAKGFHDYVAQQVGQLKACAKRFVGKPGGSSGGPMDYLAAERHCALYFEALSTKEEQIFFHADQIIRGMYSIFLEVWLRHFPRDSILAIKSEEYFESPEATLKMVYQFLRLQAPTDPKVIKAITEAGKPSSSLKDAPGILPEAMQILKELYSPYNKELARLLGDNKWLGYERQ